MSKADLIELSHRLTDRMGDLIEAGACRDCYEQLGSAYECLVEQIAEEGLEDE